MRLLRFPQEICVIPVHFLQGRLRLWRLFLVLAATTTSSVCANRVRIAGLREISSDPAQQCNGPACRSADIPLREMQFYTSAANRLKKQQQQSAASARPTRIRTSLMQLRPLHKTEIPRPENSKFVHGGIPGGEVRQSPVRGQLEAEGGHFPALRRPNRPGQEADLDAFFDPERNVPGAGGSLNSIRSNILQLSQLSQNDPPRPSRPEPTGIRDERPPTYDEQDIEYVYEDDSSSGFGDFGEESPTRSPPPPRARPIPAHISSPGPQLFDLPPMTDIVDESLMNNLMKDAMLQAVIENTASNFHGNGGGGGEVNSHNSRPSDIGNSDNRFTFQPEAFQTYDVEDEDLDPPPPPRFPQSRPPQTPPRQRPQFHHTSYDTSEDDGSGPNDDFANSGGPIRWQYNDMPDRPLDGEEHSIQQLLDEIKKKPLGSIDPNQKVPSTFLSNRPYFITEGTGAHSDQPDIEVQQPVKNVDDPKVSEMLTQDPSSSSSGFDHLFTSSKNGGSSNKGSSSSSGRPMVLKDFGSGGGPAAASPSCPSTCMCVCPSSSSQKNPWDRYGSPGQQTSDRKKDDKDGEDTRRVSVDLSLYPCARTAAYQLDIGLRLCRMDGGGNAKKREKREERARSRSGGDAAGGDYFQPS